MQTSYLGAKPGFPTPHAARAVGATLAGWPCVVLGASLAGHPRPIILLHAFRTV